MPLELLFDDAPGPAPLALAVELGWATLPTPPRTVPHLTADAAREHPQALLLLPVAEYALLQESHLIIPHLAAGGRHSAAAVLRADRRLDDVDRPLVDLDGVSRTTECLVRTTLAKFYGITPGPWARDGDALPAPPTPATDGEATQDSGALGAPDVRYLLVLEGPAQLVSRPEVYADPQVGTP